MAGPFPGMDPFLEDPKVWGQFHHVLVAALYQAVLPGSADRYRARVDMRRYSSTVPLFTSVVREDHSEEFIEILSRKDGRLVTLIEVVSPANKTTASGRTAYSGTRDRAIAMRAGTAEIDLVTQGRPLIEYSRVGLPEHDYAITVTRGNAPDRYDVETTTVRKRLPKFKLPLAHDDRDMVVDLQTVMIRAYELGHMEKFVDYSAALPSEVKLSDDSRDWVDAWLKQAKLRS